MALTCGCSICATFRCRSLISRRRPPRRAAPPSRGLFLTSRPPPPRRVARLSRTRSFRDGPPRSRSPTASSSSPLNTTTDLLRCSRTPSTGFIRVARKAACFVSYGSAGGARSVQQLRQTVIELQLAPIRSSVHIPVATLMAHYRGGDVDAGLAELEAPAGAMIDDLLWWATALKTARASAS